MTRAMRQCGAAIALIAAAVAPAGCGASAHAPDSLPYYDSADFTPHWTASSSHTLGDFSLTTQTGAALTRAGLLGHIHIANFMFTRCASICPAVTANLKKVQTALAGTDARIVSFSVTPEADPPDLLAAYGARRGIDPSRWLLVTGDHQQIYTLARDSYFADDGRVRATDEILHSEKVLLVDREGHLRGVYNGTLPFEMEKLIADVQRLQRG